MEKVLIIGATSAIAEETARLYAQRGANLALIGRNNERLQSMSSDLVIRGAGAAHVFTMDVNDTGSHKGILDQAQTALGGLDIVLIAHGTLPKQKDCEQDVGVTLQEFNTNAVSTIALLTDIANRLEKQGHGSIAVISSVAGDRGRQSNYLYGSAKAALTVFLQGLRNRLFASGVQVLTIKPGFVDTPMTAEFKKGLLWVKPAVIARSIVRAIARKKDVVYLPFFWRYIMVIIKSIPEAVFKRMSL
jgi:decaprenylphospho-beta-D-erythro-pentofuranosid-2-ulose 2-reductase